MVLLQLLSLNSSRAHTEPGDQGLCWPTDTMRIPASAGTPVFVEHVLQVCDWRFVHWDDLRSFFTHPQ